ncbi:ketopantoate reductase family protein [Halogranum rubrum]|uniref:2-dehydropantoate 2-reductase n=1 Tax=Halogranum salarium B-1 TaxID=1210908 RepID=J3A3C4_9EURY|nr:ketopantoate reductase family protein [Halogranum salarium]EJN59878.1 ketopantoate reductase [Halogranum salarium B-1]
MDIVVFGAGSLGSLVGGLLARVHEVTLVGRDPHVSHVRETGLRVTGERTAHVHPDAVVDGGNLAADLAIVTVKSFDTFDAADTLASGSFEAVLSLQNGLTEELLTTRLDAPVLAGTATYGARLLEPGQVECTGVGRVVLGALDGGTSSHAERVGKAFRDADVETLVASDMPRRRWEKLAVNAGINAVTALARVDNGALADGDAADVGHAAARETARVARAEGVRLPNRVARDALDTVVEETAKNRSSMLQDVERDKRTEVDAISGVVVDKGDDHGIDVPTNRVLAGLLRAWESERGLR